VCELRAICVGRLFRCCLSPFYCYQLSCNNNNNNNKTFSSSLFLPSVILLLVADCCKFIILVIINFIVNKHFDKLHRTRWPTEKRHSLDNQCFEVQDDLLPDAAADDLERAPLIASRAPGSSDWFDTSPLSSIGLKIELRYNPYSCWSAARCPIRSNTQLWMRNCGRSLWKSWTVLHVATAHQAGTHNHVSCTQLQRCI